METASAARPASSSGLTDDQIRQLIAYMQERAQEEAATTPEPEPEPEPEPTPEPPQEPLDQVQGRLYEPLEETRRRGASDPGSRSLLAVLTLLDRLRSQADPTLPEQDNEEYLRRMLEHYIRQAGLSRALTAQRLLRGGEGDV